jgi:hypothetical protein
MRCVALLRYFTGEHVPAVPAHLWKGVWLLHDFKIHKCMHALARRVLVIGQRIHIGTGGTTKTKTRATLPPFTR